LNRVGTGIGGPGPKWAKISGGKGGKTAGKKPKNPKNNQEKRQNRQSNLGAMVVGQFDRMVR
jgi:hypothetical protein